MSHGIKKAALITADLLIAVYIVFVFCAFNSPGEKNVVCKKVSVVIADGATHGFVDRKEVLSRIKAPGLDPRGKKFTQINCREIEDMLLNTPFIRTAQCYKTINGDVNVEITQRIPVVRIKTAEGDDFYIDDKNCIMPVSGFASNVIIATGNVDRSYATSYISPMARTLMADDFCRNLFQQINITEERRVELIPQVGNSVVMLGSLPESKDKDEQQKLIEEYVKEKMSTLLAFYKYGLPVVGWNKYSVINLEFDNQIVCKRRKNSTITMI